MSITDELYFNVELRNCLDAAGFSDCGENDQWNWWYQQLHQAHDQAVDRVTEAQRSENEKLRELCADAWHLFTEHGAVHPCDLPVVDAVRERMRELGVEAG